MFKASSLSRSKKISTHSVEGPGFHSCGRNSIEAILKLAALTFFLTSEKPCFIKTKKCTEDSQRNLEEN